MTENARRPATTTRPADLEQLNAAYVSRINNVLRYEREDLARELARAYESDRQAYVGKATTVQPRRGGGSAS
jgi:hypothetical protein